MQTPISVILICCFVAFGGFLFGYDIGLIGGIIEMDYFIQDFGQTDSNGSTIQVWKKSFIVSILSAGTFLGAVLAGPLADKVGRRMAIIHTCIIFSLGVVFQIFSNKSWQVMSFGRLIAGIGVGLISDLVPLYQVETSPKHLRGALVSCYQLAISLGILFAFFVNSYTRSFKGSSSYNIPIGLQLFYSLFLGGGIAFLNQGMIFLPDSPRILIKRDRFDEAKEALCRLWGTSLDDPRIIQEMQEMQLAHEADLAVGKVGYSELFSPEIVKRTHLAVLLQMFQQLTGINFIMYYGVTFFKNAGFKDPFKIQMITGFVNVLSTLPGIYLIDRIGRRSLMISGALLMLFGHFIVGFAGNSSTSSGYVLVWAVCLFIAGFAASWGPAVWVISSEVFPLRVRSKGVSVATASNWFWNFTLALVTPFLVDESPPSLNLGAKTALIWAFCCGFGLWFVYRNLPETSRLSLEEIEELYRSGVEPVHSASWVPEGCKSRGVRNDEEEFKEFKFSQGIVYSKVE